MNRLLTCFQPKSPAEGDEQFGLHTCSTDVGSRKIAMSDSAVDLARNGADVMFMRDTGSQMPAAFREILEKPLSQSLYSDRSESESESGSESESENSWSDSECPLSRSSAEAFAQNSRNNVFSSAQQLREKLSPLQQTKFDSVMQYLDPPLSQKVWAPQSELQSDSVMADTGYTFSFAEMTASWGKKPQMASQPKNAHAIPDATAGLGQRRWIGPKTDKEIPGSS